MKLKGPPFKSPGYHTYMYTWYDEGLIGGPCKASLWGATIGVPILGWSWRHKNWCSLSDNFHVEYFEGRSVFFYCPTNFITKDLLSFAGREHSREKKILKKATQKIDSLTFLGIMGNPYWESPSSSPWIFYIVCFVDWGVSGGTHDAKRCQSLGQLVRIVVFFQAKKKHEKNTHRSVSSWDGQFIPNEPCFFSCFFSTRQCDETCFVL